MSSFFSYLRLKWDGMPSKPVFALAGPLLDWSDGIARPGFNLVSRHIRREQAAAEAVQGRRVRLCLNFDQQQLEREPDDR
ncbi:MAG TPA: hypothetical protein VFW75_09945 [Acetobacteraceae bacterium]|nr:hypothetical protein [Acetobacteraceae bacterium]